MKARCIAVNVQTPIVLGCLNLMSPPLLRQLWQMIEEIPPYSLERLDDSDLVSWVLSHLEQNKSLKTDERAAAESYLYEHMMLIRDIAESQQLHHCPLPS